MRYSSSPRWVYPTLLAAVSDASQPRDRARTVGVYRFFARLRFALGALVAGVGADVTSPSAAIALVAALTAGSGLVVAGTSWHPAQAGGGVPAVERSERWPTTARS